MASWLIIVVGGVYAFIGISQFREGNNALGIVFMGYAFSNIGLYMAARS